MRETNKKDYRHERKVIIRKQRGHLRKRKPKRQGSRNQTGKRLPVFRPPNTAFIHWSIRPKHNQ